MLIVHVHVHVKPESVADFRQATLENARASVQEPGIARFDVVQQQDDPTRFVLVEVYRTPEAAAAHKETAHYADMARCGRAHDGRAASQREIQRSLPRSPGLVSVRFEFATATRIIFGEGVSSTLPELARSFGVRPLVVTGASAERASAIVAALSAETFAVPGEPTVDMVREGALRVQQAACDVVIAIGGGSAIDAGKAIAAIATNGGEPLDFLEVVGKGRAIRVPPLPFIAVPTTAGTGSEVTRNAVLGSPDHGVKASLRSPLMLPRVALVDPELTYGLPPAVTASTGLDALTQLIEPYVSVRANPLTDAICARESVTRLPRFAALIEMERIGKRAAKWPWQACSAAWRWPMPGSVWCMDLRRHLVAHGRRRMARCARRCCRMAWPPTWPPCAAALRNILLSNATPPSPVCSPAAAMQPRRMASNGCALSVPISTSLRSAPGESLKPTCPALSRRRPAPAACRPIRSRSPEANCWQWRQRRCKFGGSDLRRACAPCHSVV